ncbi:MAG: bifunctional pyr operon transcriptional regulator/uracil phosphoribosyltransferase [Flavobacteriales bacterium]|nr:bifunctional pyr operon transcriptional regulator/uracil phosphoribosyltransferase [Flavobacteriales bacterium]|tara:strand:+ start:1554 stop:2105 length:552 start_codon:yes stop_codon:yes gene_type:complete
MLEKKVLIDDYEMNVTIERLCHQLIENHDTFDNTVIIGIQPRGIFLSKRIVAKLNSKLTHAIVKTGCLDISFHRDDLRIRKHPIIPKSIDIDFSIEEKHVILVDDVVYTGRSVRSALDALMTFGRPNTVELLTLINRNYSRHLPIQPDYIGKNVNVLDSEKILVNWKEENKMDKVLIINSSNE